MKKTFSVRLDPEAVKRVDAMMARCNKHLVKYHYPPYENRSHFLRVVLNLGLNKILSGADLK